MTPVCLSLENLKHIGITSFSIFVVSAELGSTSKIILVSGLNLCALSSVTPLCGVCVLFLASQSVRVDQ